MIFICRYESNLEALPETFRSPKINHASIGKINSDNRRCYSKHVFHLIAFSINVEYCNIVAVNSRTLYMILFVPMKFVFVEKNVSQKELF